MRTQVVLVAAVLMAMIAAPSAQAQYGPGEEYEPIEFEPKARDMYIRAGGLYGRAELDYDEFDYYYFGFPPYPTLDYDADFNDTPGLSVAFGFSSFEVEFLYFENDDVDDADNNFFSVAFAEGQVEAGALMFNFVVDIPRHSPVSAYLGGGLGVGYYDYDIFQRNAAATEFIIDDDDGIGLGLQFLGGVRFELNPGLDLYVGGRAFWLVGDEDIVVEYFAVEVGLRIYF